MIECLKSNTFEEYLSRDVTLFKSAARALDIDPSEVAAASEQMRSLETGGGIDRALHAAKAKCSHSSIGHCFGYTKTRRPSEYLSV